jgi:hypothetical protein
LGLGLGGAIVRTKKTQGLARERKARVLAVLGEGRKTTEEVGHQLGYGGKALGNDLQALKIAGKIDRDDAKRWKLAGGSPIPEGDLLEDIVPRDTKPAKRRAKALKGNPWETKPAIVRDLYELVDRCQRAIAILEGRA